jgi:hypothetical protein
MSTSDGTVVGTTQIVNAGPASQRWNVVVMGDGYRSADLPQFAADAQAFANTLLSTPPFDTLLGAINVFRVDVASTDAGADDPAACGGSGAAPRTYFDASFCTSGIRRLLVVNNTTAFNVANAQVPQWHVIVVIVNSTVYGGSGGAVAVYSLAAGANEIALHELGHTAFGLADEYEYWAGCGVDTDRDYHPASEPAQPNVTINTTRATLKWGALVQAATPIPTTHNANCAVCDPQASPVPAGTVGLFEGAHYYHCGAFRPEFNCRMRALGLPFCAVCRERIRATLQPFMPPIAQSVGAITVDGGRPYAFVKGSDGNLWVNWWSGSAWGWSNQGRPGGVAIAQSMGAITVDGGRPYAFVTGSDGNLWVNWWSGSGWSWSNQGRPGGVAIAQPMGAITVDGGRPYTFVTGSDGNLWVNWWSGSAWGWSNQGRPGGVNIAQSMGAITVDGGRPYVFVTGSDGNLWVNFWSGSGWGWSNQHTP